MSTTLSNETRPWYWSSQVALVSEMVDMMLAVIAEFEKATAQFDPQMQDAVKYMIRNHRLSTLTDSLGLAGKGIQHCLSTMKIGLGRSLENSYWQVLPGEPPGFDILAWAARGKDELEELLGLTMAYREEAKLLTEALAITTGYGSYPTALGTVTRAGEVLHDLVALDPLFLAVGPGLASYAGYDRSGNSLARNLDVEKFVRTIELGLGVAR